MPFGKKPVGGREVDFDFIYDNVFKPAIEAVDLPDGGKLQPRRTDLDYFTAHIGQEMFQYLEYSRFAVADISGLNANVFYELGVRHRAQESGTAIFRQESGPPPFDIGQIKAFPYEYEPEDKVSESVQLIQRVLTESLAYNRLDSPVRIALLAQHAAENNPRRPNIEPLLVEADNALRMEAWPKAIEKFKEALAASPDNPVVLMKRGLVYRDQGKFAEARDDFARIIALSPDYAEAYREKGIAENKIFMKELKARHWEITADNIRKLEEELPSGEQLLRRAIELNPIDFDALSSLGGVFKRKGKMQEAYKAYQRAVEISQGNTYPLLNAITLKAHAQGRFELESGHRLLLKRSLSSLQKQVEQGFNSPWSMFDLAQVYLYMRDAEKFLYYVDEGIIACRHKWQPQTFRETLEILTGAGIALAGLGEGIAKPQDADGALPD
jgi:tetratricopeptide (TPR) repeat protein